MRISSDLSYECLVEGLPPPQVVEAVQEERCAQPIKVEEKDKYLSPMDLFREPRRHLGEQALVTAKSQKGNGWYNPFSQFYSWVVKSLWGVQEIEGSLSEADHKKIAAYVQEVKIAMAALDQLIETDEEVRVGFDGLMELIQKHREALHKKTILQQGESLKKAHKEVVRIREEIKQETAQFMERIERNGVLGKVASAVWSVMGGVGLFIGTFPMKSTGEPTLDLAIKSTVMALSALSAANVALNQPLGEYAGYLLDIAFTGVATPASSSALVLFGAKAVASMIHLRTQQLQASYQGEMGIKDNESRLATEKYNDLGTKASNEATKYFKGLGHLSEMIAENLELIKRLWN